MILKSRHVENKAIGSCLAVAVVALVIWFDFGAALNVYDGGISASGATSTLHGQLPYRDYWLLYGPMSGLALAGPTAIFGPSVALTRLLGATVLCAQAVAAYGVARTWATWAPAIVLAVSAVLMLPGIQGLEVSAWPLAMTFALSAIYASIRTSRSGYIVGILVGLSFLSRLDVGVYALLAVLVVRERRSTLLGFLAVSIPFLVFLLATTPLPALVEQLIWYPIVGPRQFRGQAGPAITIEQAAAGVLWIPLLVLPRLAIALAAARLGLLVVRSRWDAAATRGLCLMVFALACQLQTLGRGDFEHFAQAATPALLLFAIWFPVSRLSAVRFAGLAAIGASCLVVDLASYGLRGQPSAYDRSVVAVSAWLRDVTKPDDRILVGLTDHRFTYINPLIVYYLADRAPAVRYAMYNPGVTNTDWGQLQMIKDLERTDPPYIVLDRKNADVHETTIDGLTPGSHRLDDYLHARYHSICDLGSFVIEERIGMSAGTTCPVVGP